MRCHGQSKVMGKILCVEGGGGTSVTPRKSRLLAETYMLIPKWLQTLYLHGDSPSGNTCAGRNGDPQVVTGIPCLVM